MNGEFNAAAHALVCLTHKGDLLSSEALASNICTNPARVRKIMSKLKLAGLIRAKEGPEGGYRLAKEAGEITLESVANAVGVRLVSQGWQSGAVDMECLIASGMAALLDELYGQLDALCRERLAQITIADLENSIFSRSAEYVLPDSRIDPN